MKDKGKPGRKNLQREGRQGTELEVEQTRIRMMTSFVWCHEADFPPPQLRLAKGPRIRTCKQGDIVVRPFFNPI